MPGGGGGGGGGGHVLTALCDHLGLQQLNTQELDSLLRKLDAGLDGRVSIRDFQKVLCGSAPISCSTPIRAADLQRAPLRSLSLLEECSVRSTSPSLLTATVGQRVLSRLDDGSGCTSPERVIALWTEEGIRNSRDILQTLDFPLEERLSLADLTLALDNELLVGGNGLQQAALISYKNELQHLQVVAEQACCERDKVRADLDLANQRNLKLVREVDDHHVTTETLNQSRIRELEQDFRDRLASLRSQSEQENEAQLQLAERERCSLQDELRLLRAQEAELQEDLCSVTQENSRLEDELSVVKLKLTEAQSSVNKLHRDMDQLLQHKFGGLDPASGGLSHEERYSEVVRELELQCRELQDRNDELSSELLKSQKRDRKSRRSAGDANDATALSWTEPHTVNTVLDSDDSDMKRRSSPLVKKKLQLPEDTVVSGPGVSIQTELALEQLKHNHNQELQQLHIQLDTQVNYYERSLELMRQSMEVERKDIAQVFKLEISELEENKAQAEQQVKQLKETLEKLQTEIQHGGGWGSEQERRVQWERAELEQNFAREIGNLVHKLSAEKDQLEAELQLKLDQEVMLVRTRLEEVRSENGALQERLSVLQQEVQNLEDDVAKKRRKLDETQREHERSREEEERLIRENSRCREEVLVLSSRNLQLSNDNAELSARLRGDQESVRMLQERLATVSKEQEEERATVRRLQEAATQQGREKLQQQTSWSQEKQLIETELSSYKEQLVRLAGLEEELSTVTFKLQRSEEDKVKLLREADARNDKVAFALALHSGAVGVEKLGHAQEVTELQRKLQEAQAKLAALTKVQVDLRTQAEEQAARADSALGLLHVQQAARQQQAGDGRQVEQLQRLLLEGQRRSQTLEDTLKLQAQQSSVMQEQYEKAAASLRQRTEDLETKLNGVRSVLQEKVQQLKDQLTKNAKSSSLLKDVYVENAQLMAALQVTEQRQKKAEKKNVALEEKVGALNKLLREIVPAALAT